MRIVHSQNRVLARRRGFTLVEVLVTMALMAVVLPVAMRGISIAISSAAGARHKVEAASLGQTKLAEIISDATLQEDTSQLSSSGDFGDTWPLYRWSCQTSDDATLGVIQVTMTIMWIERGSERTVTISTLIQDPTVTAAAVATTTT